MPIPDELAALRRQRGLLEAQIDELDRRIAALAATNSPRSHAATSVSSVHDPILGDPEALLARLTANQPPASLVSKTGCWVVFGVVMLVVCGIVIAIALFFYK